MEQVAFETVGLLARLTSNHRWRGEVTPTIRGKTPKMGANSEVKTPIERHAVMA